MYALFLISTTPGLSSITLSSTTELRTSSIKVYKIYSYGLYAIEDDKIMLLSFKVNKNSSTDNMAEAWDDCDKQFISYIVSWLSSDIYKKLKNDRSK